MPIPEHIDVFMLDREMPSSDKTPLETVMEVDEERTRLEKEAERLSHEDRECLVFILTLPRSFYGVPIRRIYESVDVNLMPAHRL